jgi:hypothetical protein
MTKEKRKKNQIRNIFFFCVKTENDIMIDLCFIIIVIIITIFRKMFKICAIINLIKCRVYFDCK